MMSEGPGSVALQTVRLGDRGRTAKGWLVVSSGALRGILSEGPEGSVVFGFACDRRIMPEGELMIFVDLDEALAWLEKRLPVPDWPRRRPGPHQMWHVEAVEPPHTMADAERAFIAAAADYCWSIRRRTLPEHGPLAQLWRAFTDYRRLCRLPHAAKPADLNGPGL